MDAAGQYKLYLIFRAELSNRVPASPLTGSQQHGMNTCSGAIEEKKRPFSTEGVSSQCFGFLQDFLGVVAVGWTGNLIRYIKQERKLAQSQIEVRNLKNVLVCVGV